MSNKISIPYGWRGRLSPDGKHIVHGNVNQFLRNLSNPNNAISLGSYDCSGWIDNEIFGITDFQYQQVLRLMNTNGQVIETFPNIPQTSAPMFVTEDWAKWNASNNKFYRNELLIPIDDHLSGNLSGQVLDRNGNFFSAELVGEGYKTAVFNNRGTRLYTLDSKKEWAAVYNFSGNAYIFYTENEKAVFHNGSGTRFEVSSDLAENRGALVYVENVLWAWTLVFMGGLPYAFGRPFYEYAGILLQMPFDFPEVRYDEVAQEFVIQGYNSDTGELVIYNNVSIYEPRVRLNGDNPVPPINDEIILYAKGPIQSGSKIIIIVD